MLGRGRATRRASSADEIFARGFHASSWHFCTFTPGEGMGSPLPPCAPCTLHVRASYFERRRRFGAPARRTNRSGAIKLPLKATALARQRPTHGPTSAGSPAVHLPEASERRAERGSRRAGAAPTKTTPRRLRVRRRLPRQPARRLRLRCVAIGGSFVLNCRVP